MRNSISVVGIILLCGQTLLAQNENVGIGTTTPHPSAKLEVSSTTQGVLIPRMTCEQRDDVVSPANGLLVFITDTCDNGDLPGLFYFSDITNTWRKIVNITITGDGNTLDESYDEGGAGAGRMVTVDAGAVQLAGTPANTVLEVSNTTAKGIDVNTTTGVGINILVAGGDGINVTNTVSEGIEISTTGTGRGLFAENLINNSGNVIEANMGGTSGGTYYDAGGRAGYFTLLNAGSPRPALMGHTHGSTFGVLGITNLFTDANLESLPPAGVAGLSVSSSDSRNGISGLSRSGNGVWGRSTKILAWDTNPSLMKAGVYGLASEGFGNSGGATDLYTCILGYTTAGMGLLAHNEGTGHGVVGIAKGVGASTQAGVWGMTQDGAWAGVGGHTSEFPYLDGAAATNKGNVAVLAQSKSDIGMWTESQEKFGIVATIGPKLGTGSLAGFDKIAMVGMSSHAVGAAGLFINTVPSTAPTVGIISKSTSIGLSLTHIDGGRGVLVQNGTPTMMLPPVGKQALLVQQNICDFDGVDFRLDCAMSMATSLTVSNAGKGTVGSFSQTNPEAVGPTIYAINAGLSKAGHFEVSNAMNTMPATEVINLGKGNGMKITNTLGMSGYGLYVENAGSSPGPTTGGVAYFKQSAGSTAAAQTVLITSGASEAGHKTLVVTPSALTKTAAEFNGKVDILGDLTAAADVTLTSGSLDISSGDLSVGNDATIGGGLTSTEGLTVEGGGITVTGASTHTGNFTVVGTLFATTVVATTCNCAPSDIRYKKNIAPCNKALDKILRLDGVYYDWKKDLFPDRGFTDTRQIGFIAQDLEKEFPELVITDKNGYKSVNYASMTAVLVEAMKEQQKMIEELRAEVEALKH